MSVMTQRDETRMRASVSRETGAGEAAAWSRALLADLALLGEGQEPELAPGLRGLIDADLGRPLVLEGGEGADLGSLARALHRRRAHQGSIAIAIDARSGSAARDVVELGRRLRSLALEGGADAARDEILGSSLFVDHAQFLAEEELTGLLGLVDLRGEKRIVPRVVFGLRSRVPEALADLDRIRVPSLAERNGDVVAILSAVLADRRDAPRPEPEAIELLEQHDWAGGERELGHLVDEMLRRYPRGVVSASAMRELLDPCAARPDPEASLAELEEQQIYRVLEANGWNRTKSSQILGIDVKTLYNKLKRYESRKRRLERKNSN